MSTTLETNCSIRRMPTRLGDPCVPATAFRLASFLELRIVRDCLELNDWKEDRRLSMKLPRDGFDGQRWRPVLAAPWPDSRDVATCLPSPSLSAVRDHSPLASPGRFAGADTPGDGWTRWSRSLLSRRCFSIA